MRHGRYERRASTVKCGRHAKKRKLNKAVLVAFSVFLVLTVAAGGTIAYLAANGGQLINIFAPGNVACSVDTDGKITNDGNVDAYIRAAVVVNWVDGDGNVYAIAPSYTISANSNGGWKQYGEYFYYVGGGTAVVAAGAEVPVPAIVEADDSRNPDSGTYHLEIVYIAEAIQAEGVKDSDGTAAVLDAWGIVPGGN